MRRSGFPQAENPADYPTGYAGPSGDFPDGLSFGVPTAHVVFREEFCVETDFDQEELCQEMK
jgi:hypothetical protein